ncbi:MAG: imidazolonepropionase [Bacteroidia bacterium]
MTHDKHTLWGPFRQAITLADLPYKGPLHDSLLAPVPKAGLLVQGDRIVACASFDSLLHQARALGAVVHPIDDDLVCLPGWVDAHTHLCYAGSRASDYAARIAGTSYLEIARAGGGIWSSVTHTRAASTEALADGIAQRASRHLAAGVTTIEVKTGYGLAVAEEERMLQAIVRAQAMVAADLVPTCLAAHVLPRDHAGTEQTYLDLLVAELLPRIEGLCRRVDIFVEETAFGVAAARHYLRAAQALGFDLTVHADQFSAGGSALAVALGAASADHLEASGAAEIALLAASDTVAVVLPGASLGLGEPFAPARRLLDAGACLAIASDWNPGSAPMGDLLTQAAILSTYEKLSTAEVFAALTYRAAAALRLHDRGRLAAGLLADWIAFPGDDFREILYHQGRLAPVAVWKRGVKQ